MAEYFPKADLHQRKVLVTVRWCLAHYSFLNPSETITSEKHAQQIDEMHQNLQCLQLALVNRKGQFFSVSALDCTAHKRCYQVLPHPHIPPTSRQVSSTSPSASTTLCMENTSVPAGRRGRCPSSGRRRRFPGLLDPEVCWVFMSQE